MSKESFLKWVIAGLVLCNLVMLVYVLRSHDRHFHRRGRPNEMVINALKFNTEQQKTFNQLYTLHRKDIDRLNAVMADEKKALFGLIRQPAVDSVKTDSLLKKISDHHLDIEKSHFNHFLQTKSICTPDQYSLFNTFVEDVQRHVQQHYHREHHH